MLDDSFFIPKTDRERRFSFFEQQTLYEMLGKRNDDFVFIDNFPPSASSTGSGACSDVFGDSRMENRSNENGENKIIFSLQGQNTNLLPNKRKRIIIYKDAPLDDSDSDESDDSSRSKRHRRKVSKTARAEENDTKFGTKMFWTKAEDELLMKKVNELGHSWSYIAKFFPQRKPTNIMTHYKNMVAQSPSHDDFGNNEEIDGDGRAKQVKKPWSLDEERLLEEKVSEFGCNWVKIRPFFPDRSPSSISLHWSQKKKKRDFLVPSVRETKPNVWTSMEDELLLKLLKKYGIKWNELLPYFPNRSINGISQHWNSKLRPKISTEDLNQILGLTAVTNWKKADDRKLALKYKEIGPNWDEMIRFFPGTDAKFLEEKWIKQTTPIETC